MCGPARLICSGIKLVRVLALDLAGYSHDQIFRAEGRSVTIIEKWAKRVRDEYETVSDEREALSALFLLLRPVISYDYGAIHRYHADSQSASESWIRIWPSKDSRSS